MLVIISDLHLNDGTTGTVLDPGAMDLFADRLCDLALRASWRADGRYEPVEQIDLVLLGDTLDLISSRQWLEDEVRPWSDPRATGYPKTVSAIVDSILRRNVESVRRLRSLATEAMITVPAADASGQPILNEEELPLAVCTHYMVGNHDWPLHLPGREFDLIRHKVAHHLGLANLHNRPFPHDAAEGDELKETLRRHRVAARHGDIFDPLAFSEDRDASSISDALQIELLGRFVARLEAELADALPPAASAALAEITQIRPLLLVAAWMESTLERTLPNLAARREIKHLWDDLVDQFLSLEIVGQRHERSPVDLIDGLAAALKFSRRDSSDWTGKTLQWSAALRGATSESYLPHALAENDFRNRRARHIVYGHTHHGEISLLDASHADGHVLQQTYFNAGSWRRVYRCTPAAMQPEFAGAESLSLLAFYQGDERGGRAYESWSGTLAPINAEILVGQASAPAAAARGGLPPRAPHFAKSSRSAPARRGA